MRSLGSTGKVIFSMDVDGDENDRLWLWDGGRAERITPADGVMHLFGGVTPDLKTLIYTANADDPNVFDVYALNLETGESRTVLSDGENKLAASLSPDGRTFLYNRFKSNTQNELWLVDVETGETRQLPYAGAKGRFTEPVWYSDTGFCLVTDAGSEFTYLARYDTATDTFAELWREEWDIEQPTLSGDKTRLAFTVNDDGRYRLRVLDLNSAKLMDVPTLPDGYIILGRHAWRGDTLVFTLSCPDLPYSVWTLDVANKKYSQLTHPNTDGFEAGEFRTAELFRFTSFDGLSVPYQLLRPKGAEPPYGVVIEVHGGPEYQANPTFSALAQYMLSRGVAVVQPNVRGSCGYGLTYQGLDDREKRLDSVRDIGALAEHLIASGTAERGRIAIMGASYGGYMTLASITEFPELFAAAIDIVGISNIETYLENTSGYRRSHREHEYGSLSDREMLRSISPIYKASRIITPLMVAHGANDPRVPVGEADSIVAELRSRGREVVYFRFPDEGHGITKLKNILDFYPAAADFLVRRLGVYK